jgi:hypothetical protein
MTHIIVPHLILPILSYSVFDSDLNPHPCSMPYNISISSEFPSRSGANDQHFVPRQHRAITACTNSSSIVSTMPKRACYPSLWRYLTEYGYSRNAVAKSWRCGYQWLPFARRFQDFDDKGSLPAPIPGSTRWQGQLANEMGARRGRGQIEVREKWRMYSIEI